MSIRFNKLFPVGSTWDVTRVQPTPSGNIIPKYSVRVIRNRKGHIDFVRSFTNDDRHDHSCLSLLEVPWAHTPSLITVITLTPDKTKVVCIYERTT